MSVCVFGLLVPVLDSVQRFIKDETNLSPDKMSVLDIVFER